MAAITWDVASERYYEIGVSKGVHYMKGDDGTYTSGVAWNGLINITESPSGADLTKLWADGIEYASLRAAEEYAISIEAYTYPDQFAECDGSASLLAGVTIGQQTRKPFGLCYRTEIGSAENSEAGYKLHLVYNLTISPSEKSHDTVNDSPDAGTFSWDADAIGISVTGYKPTAFLDIDSRNATTAQMTAIENVLYGTTDTEPRLPLPDEVIEIMEAAATTP